MTPLKTIRLYGKLGAQFGRIHRLAVKSAAEAVRALCVLKPGFEKELMTSHGRGIEYAVFLGRKNIGQDEMHHPAGSEDIRIAPVLQGAGRGGLFQTILGAAMVAVGAWFGQGWLVNMGIGMMVGGIMQMISPQMKGLSAKDGAENGASYNFNGAVNTTAQGNPVPLGYGRMIVGSAVISAGIYAMDQK